MRKVKLLQLITLAGFPTVSSLGGGAQVIVKFLLENLDQEKFELSLAVGNEGFLTQSITHRQLKVRILPPLRREVNLLNDFWALVELRRFFKRERFDIVHTHSSKAGFIGRLAAKLAAIPIIIHTVHGFPFHDFNGRMSNRFYSEAEKLSAKITTHLICVSEKDRETAIRRKIIPSDRVSVIQPGIDLSRYDPSSRNNLKEYFQVEHPGQVVGMIARLDAQKAPEDFVLAAERVIREIKDVQFILVGDGKLRAVIEDLIKENGLTTRFILTGSRTDIPELLSIMDIYVLPSLWEGLPITILEAMAMGKPVIATNIPGNKEVIKDRINGILVPPRNPSSLANAIISLLKNRERGRVMGMAGREMVLEKYSVRQMVERIQKLYLQLVDSKMPGLQNC
jgi:glycosyltransferase involved in cell wall biosynthesis